jgi:hypothetical protein
MSVLRSVTVVDDFDLVGGGELLLGLGRVAGQASQPA